jgi:hypothetical protein
VLSDLNCLGVIVNMEIVHQRNQKYLLQGWPRSLFQVSFNWSHRVADSRSAKVLTDDIQLESIILRIITGKEA